MRKTSVELSTNFYRNKKKTVQPGSTTRNQHLRQHELVSVDCTIVDTNKIAKETELQNYSSEFIPVFRSVRVTQSLVLCVCFVDGCLSFCPFFLVIVLPVFRFTDSDCPFGVFKLFLHKTCLQSIKENSVSINQSINQSILSLLF